MIRNASGLGVPVLIAVLAALGACETMQGGLQSIESGLHGAARSVDGLAGRLISGEPVARSAAVDADADRLYRDGVKAMEGDGVPQSDAKAAELFYDAAQRGHADAQFMLGLLHQTGRGASQDDAAAAQWFRRAAAQQHAQAQFFLGLAHLRGRGVAPSESEANAWFAKAAAAGHSGAQYQLGLAYATGAGVPRKDATALEWFEKSAEQGHPEAQFFAGQSYTHGWGTGVDHAWAARWYGKAAEQGLAKAQYQLGVAYAAGLGLPKDRIEAYKWVLLAAEQNDAEAVKMTAALARKTSAAEVTQATGRARQWKPASAGPFADPPTVRFVQMALGALGFQPGPADGQLGQRTQQALASYQAREGIGAKGTVTPEVIQKLRTDRPH